MLRYQSQTVVHIMKKPEIKDNLLDLSERPYLIKKYYLGWINLDGNEPNKRSAGRKRH